MLNKTHGHKDIYIVGGGRSLLGFDFDKIKNKGLIIGVNESFFIADCDVCFSIDICWIRSNNKRIKQAVDAGKTVALAVSPHQMQDKWVIDRAQYFLRRHRSILSENVGEISGDNSGHGALNLAYHLRPRRIFLLGIDLRSDASVTHWHDVYSNIGNYKKSYNHWTAQFEETKRYLDAAGIEVYNCNPDSNVAVFRKDVSYGDL